MNVQKSFLLFLIFSILLTACDSIAPLASIEVLLYSTNPELNDISGFTKLKSVFNQDQGKVRLILMMPNGSSYYYASDNRYFTWLEALKESNKIAPHCPQ